MMFVRRWVVAALMMLFCLSPLQAAGKRYDILGVWVNAYLHEDGSMDVVEQRQYRFVGNFTWASYELPLAGTGGVRDVRLSEGEMEYCLDDSQEPGTYTIEQTAELLRVRWYYRARNQVRTFTLRFRLLDVVRRHPDVAVLYYQFVGSGWDKPSGSVTVRIVPPQPLATGQVRAWAHGPLWGNVLIRDDGTILADVAQLPKRRFWEVRALYPAQVFAGAPVQPDSVQAVILQEEAAWAERANLERQQALAGEASKKARKEHGRWFVALLSVGGLLSWWNIYRVYGRRHPVPGQPALSGVPPTDTPPALVSYLVFDRTVSANAMVATLLDLARRGLIKIVEEQPAGDRRGRIPKPEYVLELDRERARRDADEGRLLLYERTLLAYLFGPLSDGETRLSLAELKRHRSATASFFSQWSKEVATEARARNFYDQESLRAMKRSLLLSGLLLLLTVAAGFLVEEWALLLAGVTLGVFALSFLVPRRTPEAEVEARQWKALSRYLAKFGAKDAQFTEYPSEVDKLLVYGTALGVRSKAMEAFLGQMPEEQLATFSWYVGGIASRPGGGIAEALSSMVSTVTSSVSSATGAGGGAGGSGGGAG
jgi:uncharacterized membrane protein